MEKENQPDSIVPPPSIPNWDAPLGPKKHTQININLDGRQFAQVMVDHIGQMAGPLSGPGGFDPRRSYTPVEVG